MKADAKFRISVDTGGTFTDVLVTDEAGSYVIGKALTTHERIFDGMAEGLKIAAETLGMPVGELLSRTEMLIYGTTRSTNATVTGKTAKTALLVTEGFPDILVLREGGRANAHDFDTEYPQPYIPRRYTFEVPERIRADGSVSLALDETAARAILEKLKGQRFEALAVCLLWSVVNPEHEKRLGTLIEEILPGIPYTLSHALLPVVREYRRASATAIDASLKPLMQEHLRGLERDLRSAGYAGEVLVSTSIGGTMSISELIESPIYTVKSGPAMAPVAAAKFSAVEDLGGNVIVCDTGGTTFDVGLVRDGNLTYSRDSWIGPAWTGHLMGISSVDIRSLGAGGGSIAWIDDGGLLRVGPQSAGSMPGPACYGRGGTLPTVSDAACVLGYFNPEAFLGGRMKLDREAARRALAPLAEQMGRSVEQAAYSIIVIASELMIKAIHEVTIAEGLNPRDSTMVAGGGAAGINIMMIARELGSANVVLPRAASALSAAGMQFADIVKEEVAASAATSERFDFAGVNDVLTDLKARLDRFVASLGPHAAAAAKTSFFAEARYLGQVWQLDTPLEAAGLSSEADLTRLLDSFHAVHERVFAVSDRQSAVEFVNWKGRVTVGVGKHMANGTPTGAAPPLATPAQTRPCFFDGPEPVETPIFAGGDLEPGHCIVGPAIIEEPTTTLVVYPGTSASLSPSGNYLLSFS